MRAEPQADAGANPSGQRLDAAEYLASILPELAEIARHGGMEDLGLQIDKVAELARSIRRSG